MESSFPFFEAVDVEEEEEFGFGLAQQTHASAMASLGTKHSLQVHGLGVEAEVESFFPFFEAKLSELFQLAVEV